MQYIFFKLPKPFVSNTEEEIGGLRETDRLRSGNVMGAILHEPLVLRAIFKSNRRWQTCYPFEEWCHHG